MAYSTKSLASSVSVPLIWIWKSARYRRSCRRTRWCLRPTRTAAASPLTPENAAPPMNGRRGSVARDTSLGVTSIADRLKRCLRPVQNPLMLSRVVAVLPVSATAL